MTVQFVIKDENDGDQTFQIECDSIRQIYSNLFIQLGEHNSIDYVVEGTVKDTQDLEHDYVEFLGEHVIYDETLGYLSIFNVKYIDLFIKDDDTTNN